MNDVMNFALHVELFQNEDLNCRSFRIPVDCPLKTASYFLSL